MKYWDASALLPVLVTESTSVKVAAWLRADREIVTWAWTRVEVVSALERRIRESSHGNVTRRKMLMAAETFAAMWSEVDDLLAVRNRAIPLLGRHPLRAADAGQLAAALLVQEQAGVRLEFVCLDLRLCDAAEREGLRVLTV